MIKIVDNLTQIMDERYYQEGETTPQQMIRRVAKFVASGEKKLNKAGRLHLEEEYYRTMNERKWLPSSPFLMNAGTKVPMLSACFVVGGVEDKLEKIYTAVARQGIINKAGGGTGFNFSKLREEGAPIRSTGGTSSGVMSFMELFNTNGDIIKQGGRRRSANIGVLRIDHPEIEKFIDYKLNADKLNNFNISVLVDNKFMNAVRLDENHCLLSPLDGSVVKVIRARDLYDKIMQNNWRSAEPAMLFVDNINQFNPMVMYLGFIDTTNPCGEITLYPDEACNLASINLEEFIDFNGRVDWDDLKYVVGLVTRFLDTSIDVNLFPDEIIEAKVKELRRLGLGIMSLHGALIKAGYTYSSEEGRRFAKELMKFVNECATEASMKLAQEKGAFPLFEKSSYDQSKPMRNVAVTTIAPTGTIQQILNTSSSGCEPIFAIAYKRSVLTNEGKKETFWVNPFFEEFAKQKGFWSDYLPEIIYTNRGRVKGVDQIPAQYQNLFETAMEISPENHVRMQAVLQEHVDNSISKTINLPREATVEEIADAYMLGWELGLKGMTVYREGSRDNVVLEVGGHDEKEVSKTLERGVIAPAPEDSHESKTKKLETGCGNIYLTMDKDENGNIIQTFVNRGSKGTCQANQVAVSRLISLSLRAGVEINSVIDQLMSVPVCPSYYGKKMTGGSVSKGSSCPSAIGFALKEYANQGGTMAKVEKMIERVEEMYKPNSIELGVIPTIEVIKSNCPKCNEPLAFEGGCSSCYACGYSKCS